MSKTIKSFLLLIMLSSFPTAFLNAANFVAWDKKGDKWLQQTSTHFSISYLEVHQENATRVLKIAEQVHQQLQPFFKVTPEKRTEIILLDDIDNLSGHESTLEYGEIRLVMSPPTDINTIEIEDDWLPITLAHEYSYILQMQLSQGTLRGLFISAEFTPAMLLEGVAIYLEKNNQLKTDRLDSSNFHMQIRLQVQSEQLQDLQKVVLHNREWPLTSTYIYGAYFINYLAKTYGEEKLLTFLENYSQNLISYLFLNRETEKVYGKDFLTLWQDFKVDLNNEFSEQIKTLEKQEVDGETLFSSPFIQATASSIEGLLVNKINGEDRHEIAQYHDEKWHSITPTNQLKDIDSHPQAGLITTRTINYVDGHQYNDIFLYNNNNWRRLTERARFTNVRFTPDGKSILATRIVAGLSELWLLNIENKNSTLKLWQGTENVILGEFDIAPSGEFLVASIKYPQSQWKLMTFDLNSKQWKNISDQQGNENSPEFLADGSILYSANYTGISNIYRLDFKKSTITQWTAVIGGAFQPIWQAGLGLVFQSYEKNSYTIRHIEKPEPITVFAYSNVQHHDKKVLQLNEQIEISPPVSYSTWQTIQPHSWLPVLYVDEVRSLVGLNTYGGDALGRHNYEIYALWDVKNKLGSYLFEYRYDNRWAIAYLHDYKFKNVSLDKLNPHYQISSNQTYVAQRNHIFSAWEDKLSFHAGISMSFDSLFYQPTNIQQTEPTFDIDATEITTGIALTFDNREYYFNVPDVGWGHYYDFTFEENILNSDFNGQKYQTQWRVTWDLPGRITILTRLSAGYSSDDAKRYSLGGNNLKQEMNLFDRNSQAIRGYDDVALVGHVYATQRIEINSLLMRFERNWGLFPLGMGDIAGTVFVDSGSAWDVGEKYDPITGFGAQIQLEFKLGYNYALPINLGYAYGTDDALGKDYFYLNFGSAY
ncbi:hypothetical protein [Psychromonas hadalis]|uniref:hypothetical protein n=1 Tax=Psychromonas hadalis TaxID=211669 RepID=UPI0003B2E814|nr:hypothetical protein [Psychromonas hadalis]